LREEASVSSCPRNSNRTNIYPLTRWVVFRSVYMTLRELLAQASSRRFIKGDKGLLRRKADLFPSHGIGDRRPSWCILLTAQTAWKTFGEEIRRMGIRDRLNLEGCRDVGRATYFCSWNVGRAKMQSSGSMHCAMADVSVTISSSLDHRRRRAT